MKAPQWWPLVTVLKAMAHCLVSHEHSDLTDSESQDSLPGPALPCHKISVGNIDFAFSLYRQLALDAPGENILISPVIISSALAKLFLGAPAANRTQLLEGLGFNLTMLPEVEIQEGFQDLSLRLPAQDPQLLLTMGQRTFHGLGGGAIQDPMEAQKHIQEHAEKQSQGNLGAWVEELGNQTAAVLLNLILLRGRTAHIHCGVFFQDQGSKHTPAPLLKASQKPPLLRYWKHSITIFLLNPRCLCLYTSSDRELIICLILMLFVEFVFEEALFQLQCA